MKLGDEAMSMQSPFILSQWLKITKNSHFVTLRAKRATFTLLSDRLTLLGQELVENAKIQMRQFWAIFKHCAH